MRLFAVVAFSSVMVTASGGAQVRSRVPQKTSIEATESIPLPITSVSLYKNGVGFFEHAGRVTGNEQVTIDFTTAQLNDVLQSLTAIDLGGGRIAGAGYNSTTPLEQQLKALPISLGEDPSAVEFYNSIRGTRVEVRGVGVAVIAGRLLSVEVQTVPPSKDGGIATEKRFLTVVSDAGAVRTVELTAGTEVRLLDAGLHQDVTRYLEILAENRNSGLRHLRLQDNGSGTRDLQVSYISEVPIWKSTYRILFTGPVGGAGAKHTATLQGWSVVDNTTGSDWLNVRLALIAGAPQSFIQPLSTPYYSRRPEIPLPQEAQLAPQTHESGEEAKAGSSGVQGRVVDQSGAVIPNARVTVTNTATGSSVSSFTDGNGSFSVGVQGSGQYTMEVAAPGFERLIRRNVSVGSGLMAGLDLTLRVGSASETVNVDAPSDLPINGRSMAMQKASRAGMAGMVGGVMAAPAMAYEESAASSIVPQTSTRAFDDFFEYKIAQPITIRKNESALVPILQTKVDAERVTLWSPQQPSALRALWITNTSDLTLDRGSFTIVEDGSFGGEGLLDPIHPAERRLLSYAADQAVRVTADQANTTRRVEQITIAKGVLKETTAEVADVEYMVKNAAPEGRTVVVEQPRRMGWTLDSDPKPTETTPTSYRFRVETKAGETVRLHIGEKHTLNQVYRLVNTNEDQLLVILRNAKASAGLVAQLEPVFAAKRAVVGLDEQIRAKEASVAEITNDQKRLRENLSALKGSVEERALVKRYTEQLNGQEDQLAALTKQMAGLRQQRAAAQADLEGKIEGLTLEETVLRLDRRTIRDKADTGSLRE